MTKPRPMSICPLRLCSRLSETSDRRAKRLCPSGADRHVRTQQHFDLCVPSNRLLSLLVDEKSPFDATDQRKEGKTEGRNKTRKGRRKGRKVGTRDGKKWENLKAKLEREREKANTHRELKGEGAVSGNG